MSRRISRRMKFKLAKKMRLNPTPAEALLWERLRKAPLGFTFKPQVVLYGYIPDFYCPEVGLVVEVDGSSHEGREAYDAARTLHLEEKGLTVLRVTNEMVLENPRAVLVRIRRALRRAQGGQQGSQARPVGRRAPVG